MILTDGSRIIIESCVRAGAEVFIGYPITPANLLYQYGVQRFPIALSAPDEITALQWMAGFSSTGKFPVTATSFPGFALMIESINMAFMMELPMLVILAQRLGPSTGSATCGAQGDVRLVSGIISGGYHIPTFCISELKDCWELTASAVKIAIQLRTPVILLTSKEMIMTLQSFNRKDLLKIKPLKLRLYEGDSPYIPYLPNEDLVPSFLPIGNNKHQVRLTASTHDKKGLLQHSADEATANTARLHNKIVKNLPKFTYYELKEMEEVKTLIFSYGITSYAVRDAVQLLKEKGFPVSLLIAKTLLPVPLEYFKILDRYERVIIAEENLTGQYCEILFGAKRPAFVRKVCSIGKMITPQRLVEESLKYGKKIPKYR